MLRNLHLLAFLTSLSAFAQITAFDPTFNPEDQGMARFDGLFAHPYAPGDGVTRISVQADGKLLVGGIFTGGVLGINDPVLKPGLARLNTDGTHDPTFNAGTGLDGGISCIVQQPDGKLLLGGSFTTYNGNSSKGIVRLNLDGSFDPTFNVGGGAAGSVQEIALQSDGKLLLSGTFITFNGSTAVRIVRLMSNGSVDPSFNTGTSFDGAVRAIAVQADGKILVGGDFTHYQGTQRNYLARLSSTGVLDPFYNDNTLVTGPGGPLADIAVGNAGSAFISFNSNEFNGTPVGYAPIKLDVNGARIVTFDGLSQLGPCKLQYNAASNTLTALGAWNIAHRVNGNTGDGGYGYGHYIAWYKRINCSMLIVDWSKGAVGPNGEVYQLLAYHSGILRTHDDLSLDTDFRTGSGLGYLDPLNVGMTVDGAGRIVIAGRVGNFDAQSAYNGHFGPNATRIGFNGDFDGGFTLPYGFEGNITHVAWLGDERYALARPLSPTSCSDPPSAGLKLINVFDAATSTLTGMAPPGCVGLSATMGDLVKLSSGALLYAGNVDCMGSGLDVGRFTPSDTWDAAYTTTDLDGAPDRIAEAPDGKVYVVGDFTAANGVTRNRIVRLLVSGGVDPGFDPLSGFDGRVRDAVVNPDGTIVCVGDFNTYRGAAAPHIAKLLPNGAMDPSFTPGTGVANTPFCLLRYPDGRLLVGGAIPLYDGHIVNGLVVLNANGTIDPTSDTSEGFRINNGTYPGGGTVYEMELQPNGQVICMGEFHMYNGQGRNRICRIGTPTSPMMMARALLEGPYVGDGAMSALLGPAHIPLQEPYGDLGFEQQGGGGEAISPAVLFQQGPQAVVDWIQVELRSANDPTDIVATRSGLLLANGSIVETDGQSFLRFWGTPQGAYHVALRHRNHLGVMTATPIFLGFSPSQLDFSQPYMPLYGTDARKQVGDDMLLWAGDVNRDGELKYTGAGNDRDPILVSIGSNVPTNTITGYSVEDINLDGVVKYTGTDNDRDPILQNIGGSVPTTTRQEQLP